MTSSRGQGWARRSSLPSSRKPWQRGLSPSRQDSQGQNQIFGVIVVLGIKLWRRVLTAVALTFIRESGSWRQGAPTMGHPLVGSLVRTGIRCTIVIQERHNLVTISGSSYPMAASFMAKDVGEVGEDP